MDKPFLTVVIPTLNEEKLLPRLLASLSEQTYTDFEVIVVDARSEDRTVWEARKFSKSLPAFKICLSDKKNVSWQRNMGAGLARGEYLVFFDADVQVPPDFLELVAEHLVKKKSVFLTTWVKTEGDKLQDGFISALMNWGSGAARIVRRPYAGGYNTVVLKSIFDHVGGFNPAVFNGEDHDFTVRCYDAGVNLDILKNPRIVYSTRRYAKYGLLSVWGKNTRSFLGILLRKPLTKPVFDYPMGGGVYK